MMFLLWLKEVDENDKIKIEYGDNDNNIDVVVGCGGGGVFRLVWFYKSIMHWNLPPPKKIKDPNILVEMNSAGWYICDLI